MVADCGFVRCEYVGLLVFMNKVTSKIRFDFYCKEGLAI